MNNLLNNNNMNRRREILASPSLSDPHVFFSVCILFGFVSGSR